MKQDDDNENKMIECLTNNQSQMKVSEITGGYEMQSISETMKSMHAANDLNLKSKQKLRTTKNEKEKSKGDELK